jgi:hypothetical protein
MKFCPVETKLFCGDGQTHSTKLRVAFRNFRKAPKMTSTRIATVLRTLDPKILYKILLCHLTKYLLIDRNGIFKIFKFLSCVTIITLKPNV